MRPLIGFDGGPGEPHWVALNDGVMGGCSTGAPAIADGRLEFRGALSLANNGGFASVRSVGRHFDLSGATAVVLRVRRAEREEDVRVERAPYARHRDAGR